MIDLYLMAPPPPGWALRARANFRSRDADAVDPLRARAEWLVLARAIEARGGTVIALPTPSDALTGMPYAAEAGQIVDRADGPPRFILPRMISPHRQPERDHRRARGTRAVARGRGRGAGDRRGLRRAIDGGMD